MLKLSPLCYPRATLVLKKEKKKISRLEMVWDILRTFQRCLDQLLCKILLA